MGDRRGAANRPGPLAGLAFGAALGAGVFLLAHFIQECASGRRTPAKPPAGFSYGGDARAPARVLATMGGPGLRAVLLPLREDGGSTEAEEAILNGALFPGQPPRRFARLLVANPRGAARHAVDLGPGRVVLETGGGPVGNVDLAAAVAARLPALSPHRILDLQVSRAADATVDVEGGGYVRVLVAFPPGSDPLQAAGASLASGTRLLPREVAVEGLRTALLDGRVDALQDVERAEAKGGRR